VENLREEKMSLLVLPVAAVPILRILRFLLTVEAVCTEPPELSTVIWTTSPNVLTWSMPLKGIPLSLTPELLYALARMGHGDMLVIGDGNFPSDSIASHGQVKLPIRVHGSTSSILHDILQLFPLDSYDPKGVCVMDRVPHDKEGGLQVPAYEAIATECGLASNELNYVERYEFYELAKQCFCVIQTDDSALYANVIIRKGVLSPSSEDREKSRLTDY
jgi:L-fucose mutarotase